MNIDKLKVVRDVLRDDSLRGVTFDMKVALEPSHECGTAACIAGYTVLIFAPEEFGDPECLDADDVTTRAREILGLTPEQEVDLFYPEDMASITRADAVDALDALIASVEQAKAAA